MYPSHPSPYTSPLVEQAVARAAAAEERHPGRSWSFRCADDVCESPQWGERPTPREEAPAMFAARWRQHGEHVLALAHRDPHPGTVLLVDHLHEWGWGEESRRRLRPGQRRALHWLPVQRCPRCASDFELARKVLKGLVLGDTSCFRAGLNALQDRWGFGSLPRWGADGLPALRPRVPPELRYVAAVRLPGLRALCLGLSRDEIHAARSAEDAAELRRLRALAHPEKWAPWEGGRSEAWAAFLALHQQQSQPMPPAEQAPQGG